jgi:hypothetical protein
MCQFSNVSTGPAKAAQTYRVILRVILETDFANPAVWMIHTVQKMLLQFVLAAK